MSTKSTPQSPKHRSGNDPRVKKLFTLRKSLAIALEQRVVDLHDQEDRVVTQSELVEKALVMYLAKKKR
jgi:hypothetical protein